MFTGLVEALGRVVSRADEPGGRRLVVHEPRLAAELHVGESVAVNGACLTVVETGSDQFAFQLGPETLAKTNLGGLRSGDRVNLERALRVGDRLGGHWVLGHVDGVAHIVSPRAEGEPGDFEIVEFDCPIDLTQQMIAKGSIAVDGVSLTLVDVADGRFSVMLIPHTLAMTTLGFKQAGAAVNLEVDMLGKYVLKYVQQIHASSPPSPPAPLPQRGEGRKKE